MTTLLSRRFVLAWLLSFFSGLAFFLFVHFPRYLEGLGAGETEIGLIVGVSALAAIVIRPAVGREMDRRGRRPVILVGNVVSVVSLLLYLTVEDIGPWLYIVRIIHGLGGALLFTALFTYAADLVPQERRTQGLALFGVSGMLPIAVGGVLGDALLAHFAFESLFIASFGLGIVGLVIGLFLTESAPPVAESDRVPFMRSLLQPDLIPLWWVTLVFAFALSAYFTFLRTFIDETGIGSVGSFFAAYATTAITLRLVAGWLPDRIGAKRVLYPAMALFATGFLLLASAHSGIAIVIAGVFCGAGHGYGFPILFAIAFGRASSASRGAAAAIFTGLFDLGALTGAPILGTLVSRLGYPSMFRLSALWVGVGMLSFAWWDRDLRLRRRA
ncbi:MAG: MFS transporter [Actinomycetota bacterium]